MTNSIKITSLVLLLLLISIQTNAQKLDKNNRLVYDVNEFETGKFLHDFMLIGPFPNLLPEGVTDYFHLDATCLGFSNDYLSSTGGEEKAEPFIDQTVTFDNDKKLTWQKYHSSTDKINLKKVNAYPYICLK